LVDAVTINKAGSMPYKAQSTKAPKKSTQPIAKSLYLKYLYRRPGIFQVNDRLKTGAFSAITQSAAAC
jgi:hypothetical protein